MSMADLFVDFSWLHSHAVGLSPFVT